MADYYSPNRSPFFKTFGTPRVGNVVKNRMPPPKRNSSSNASEEGSLQHFPMLRGHLAGEAATQQQRMQQQPNTSHQRQAVMPNMQPMIPNIQPVAPMQPLALPPLPPPPPQAPPTPQTAAEHFRHVNRGLPDGVRFEPLDEETKAALKKIGKLVPEAEQPPNPQPLSSPPQPPPKQPPLATPPHPQPVAKPDTSLVTHPPSLEVPSPALTLMEPEPFEGQVSQESAELLERLIQDERNAILYYRHLSEISPTVELEDSLQAIFKECEARQRQYQQILKSLHGRIFEPQDTQINTTVEFGRGMEIAVMEEKKILDTVAELIDMLGAKASTVQNIMNRGIVRLNWLQWTVFRLSS